ncbi:MAG: hypothetical protein IJS87_09015 [Rhodocyclaceae bacterium]|nr:hypothetical protein [Rhodocyclaceae bacterium]
MKYVSDQLVEIHLKRLNPWWQRGEVDEDARKLRPRAYLDAVRALLLAPQ